MTVCKQEKTPVMQIVKFIENVNLLPISDNTHLAEAHRFPMLIEHRPQVCKQQSCDPVFTMDDKGRGSVCPNTSHSDQLFLTDVY